MTVGTTTTGSLADSLPKILASARIVREQVGNMSQLVDVVTLGTGDGLDWNEISLSQLVAQAVTESTDLDNPQQIEDTILTITPTTVGIQTRITDRVRNRISANVYAKIGQLAQNAIQRKKDEDGVAVLDSGATTSSPGAGGTLTSGHIAAAKYNISSNTTEPGPGPYRCVLHGFQIKDLFDELTSGVGTYVVNDGPTANVFASGFQLPIAGCEIYEDGNITIDASDDAKGGVFSMSGIILVQGAAPRMETERKPNIGGGAWDIFHYDEYSYGLRSSTNWVQEIQSDATAPTS